MGTAAGLHHYPKPYKSIADQIALLESRGMQITDKAAASACLQRIGYYRLSGYWYPFRESHVSTDTIQGRTRTIVEDNFRIGTTFQRIMELYVFDKRLRLLFLDAIERVEVSLRVEIALLLGNRNPWAHRDPNQLHGNFTKKVNPHTGETEFTKWLNRMDDTFYRSKEEFVKHFKIKYLGENPPIWIAIELWDFGMLSVFLSGMKFEDRTKLAEKYGLPRPDLLTSWCRNINNIRNICAHHSRLWNRSPADQISPPRRGEIPVLDHMSASRTTQTRIYATASVLQLFLKAINPNSSWSVRLKSLCGTFPNSVEANIEQAGFPKDWEDEPLWQ